MKTVATLVTTLFLWPLSVCQAQVIQVEITEVPYEAPYAFLAFHYGFGGNQTVERKSGGASATTPQTEYSLRIQGARDTNIQAEIELGYRKIDLENLGDSEGLSFTSVGLGGRYYPRYPTFGLGSGLAGRLTASALGGFTYSGNRSTTDLLGQEVFTDGSFSTDLRLTAGLAFSGREEPSGLTAEIVYRPNSASNLEYSAEPAWAIRIGFLFGP